MKVESAPWPLGEGERGNFHSLVAFFLLSFAQL